MEISFVELEVTPPESTNYQMVTNTVRFPRSNAYAQILLSYESKQESQKLPVYRLLCRIDQWANADGKVVRPEGNPCALLMADAVEVTFALEGISRNAAALGTVFLLG